MTPVRLLGANLRKLRPFKECDVSRVTMTKSFLLQQYPESRSSTTAAKPGASISVSPGVWTNYNLCYQKNPWK